MNPRKITACMMPGFHSRKTIRDCRKPLTSTVCKRASGWSQRASGASLTTMASLRHASTPNAMSAIASNSVIAIGFMKALGARHLLLQGQDPIHQIPDVSDPVAFIYPEWYSILRTLHDYVATHRNGG